MDRTQTLGAVLAGVGVAGYVLGVVTPYSGRAFAVTATMVGLTLLAVGDPDSAATGGGPR